MGWILALVGILSGLLLSVSIEVIRCYSLLTCSMSIAVTSNGML